jgi:hypothetical protein
MDNNATGTYDGCDLGCVRILAHLAAGTDARGLWLRGGGNVLDHL